MLNQIKFSTDTGPSAYFAEFREIIDIAAGVSSSDIVPLTILAKICKDIPVEVNEFLLLTRSLGKDRVKLTVKRGKKRGRS